MEKQESRSLTMILWRRKWIILVAAIVALGAGIGVSIVRTPLYRASVVLLRDQGSIDMTLFGTNIYSSGDVQRDLITTARSLTSLRVASLVKDATESQLSTGQLLNMVTAEPSTDSNTISVRVVGPDPAAAAALADAFAEQTIELRKASDQAALTTAREALEAELGLMTPADLASSRGQELLSRINQLKILEQLQTGGYTLWQHSQVPGSAISPRPIRDSGAAFAVGLVLGLVLALGIDRLDRRLKDDSDFKREFGLPVLALIPQIGRRWKQHHESPNGIVGFKEGDSPTLESYRLLRSNLQYFEVENGLKSILVTSGLPGEAKTVTVTNLALSLALSGARVILVDSDLRNPLMHRYLHLDNSVGLSTVLAGAARVEDAVKVVKIAEFLPNRESPLITAHGDTPLYKDFLCLTSGPLPPNPAELLASSRMGDILGKLTTLADHVLIDSAPVLLVADAVSLASRVDGVIVVSRAGSATIDQAHEIRSTLDRVGARLVGLVISGVKTGAVGHYRQGYYSQKGA